MSHRIPPPLIFDMDGVIIHSTPVHNQAWRLYLRRHGIEEPLAAIQANMLGKHNDEIVRIFFGDGLSQTAISRHGAAKESLYREMLGEHLSRHLVPGVVEFVRRHRAAPMAVASNAEPANVSFVLSGSGIKPLFRVVLDSHQVERPKPDPEIYFRAARELGADPSACIVFEDSDTGVRAARDAGARVVGLLTTTRELNGCDLTVADFRDPRLESWLAARVKPAAHRRRHRIQ